MVICQGAQWLPGSGRAAEREKERLQWRQKEGMAGREIMMTREGHRKLILKCTKGGNKGNKGNKGNRKVMSKWLLISEFPNEQGFVASPKMATRDAVMKETDQRVCGRAAYGNQEKLLLLQLLGSEDGGLCGQRGQTCSCTGDLMDDSRGLA